MTSWCKVKALARMMSPILGGIDDRMDMNGVVLQNRRPFHRDPLSKTVKERYVMQTLVISDRCIWEPPLLSTAQSIPELYNGPTE